MSTPLHDLRVKIVETTISTLQGMRRFKKNKDIKALEKIIAELQAKLDVLKKQG